MISELLTIVIPTRDRPDLLEKCLRSVFERQTRIPHVVVSDNSTCDIQAIRGLQRRYEFAYVRQSGNLDQTSHLNSCMLELPSTPWVLLLHDDDELYPDSLATLETFLGECQNAGIVLAGVEHINQHDEARGTWIPKHKGTFRGENGLVRLGLDGWAYPPSTILSTEACRHLGGFPGIGGIAADHMLALQLAYAYGVAFFPHILGRYRSGSQQSFDVSTPGHPAGWVNFTVQEAELMRKLSCSADVLDRLVDYRTWGIFMMAIPYVESDLSVALGLTRKCLRVSPRAGEWQNRARREHPYLFLRPQWVARLLCSHNSSLRKMLPVQTRRRLRDAICSLLAA